MLGGAILSLLVARTASRAYRLASYFRETLEKASPLHQIFRTRDEFSFLNEQFNQVINDARLAEEQRLAQERAFRFLIEHAPAGFFKTNRNGELLYINPHCASMLGYTQSEAMAELHSVRKVYYDGQDRDLFLHDLLEHGEVRNRKMRFVKKSGEIFWISMTARLSPDVAESSEDQDFDIEGFLIDVTSDMEERRSLVSMAETDALTGAANRRAFDAAAEAFADRAQATGEKIALVLLDIDRFKPINDTYGHGVGDCLLQQIASLGKHNLREDDIFARIGGDEFAILLPGAGEEAAARLAERLREGVWSMTLPDPLPEPPTLSIGLSVQEGPNVQVSRLLKTADAAMYRAKQAGRDRAERDRDR